MFIDYINDFLPKYQNLSKEEFLSILKKSNTGKFDEYKLEKDFLLTLILIKFGEKYPDLIFKGGTCLNKIYFPYFRLSEDLDFVINKELGRSARQTLLKEYEKNFIDNLKILDIKLKHERTKFDEHKLAMFVFEYESTLDNSIQTIKIDLSLKKSLMLPSIQKSIIAIYKDSVLEETIFQNHTINCIDLKESVAEKTRASLTRKEPAIRDFFDIRYIKNNTEFDFEDKGFKQLVHKKLEEVDFKYTIDKVYNLLEQQVLTDLNPVLKDNYDFNFPEIYQFILSHKN
ncbi:MAG: nucleotidyl transferase AbiEii/AbiGii toxin family protein [Candidatus Absconditabacteria bacterium]|nr:nucleotidyl transferase AbiEii/AbiGii toxin family protein [Candidatus Absconditabacteria bacterium]